MIPSINDLTSYWQFDDFLTFRTYAGILFGKNILVYHKKYVDLTQLLNDNSRIYNSTQRNGYIYVLLENNNLYEIKLDDFITYKFVHKNVKDIFMYDRCIHMLQNDGNILNKEMKVLHKNIHIVPKIPQFENNYMFLFICNRENNLLLLNNGHIDDSLNNKLININNNTIIDICVVYNIIYILYNNNTIDICDTLGKIITTKALQNINSISAISSGQFGIIFDDNNVIIDREINCEINGVIADTIDHNYKTYKAISIPNSPYCANFNTETIPYYPKYFMDRFIAFVMSVKYGCNIKLPKYLYFMIANYLK